MFICLFPSWWKKARAACDLEMLMQTDDNAIEQVAQNWETNIYMNMKFNKGKERDPNKKLSSAAVCFWIAHTHLCSIWISFGYLFLAILLAIVDGGGLFAVSMLLYRQQFRAEDEKREHTKRLFHTSISWHNRLWIRPKINATIWHNISSCPFGTSTFKRVWPRESKQLSDRIKYDIGSVVCLFSECLAEN